MNIPTYQPSRTVTGPAYSTWFKLLATVFCGGLLVYGISVALRFPLMHYGFGVKMLLGCAALLLALSYYWFMRSTVTIDESGITQTWIYRRHVAWQDIRGAKFIGIPYASAVFPPRLVIRTSHSFSTFNGGNQAILAEFARIALAYQFRH